MKTEARKLVAASADYAAYAVRHLWNPPGGMSGLSQDRIFGRLLEFQVHYLFPNLSDDERCILTALKWVALGLTVNVNTPTNDLSGEERRRHEELVSQNESLFMLSKERIDREDFLAKLSPLQRQVIEDEFLAIVFKHA
jgi:hypothetical protein